MHILLHTYKIDPNMVDIIRRMYIETKGQVVGEQMHFDTTMGVC